MKRITLEHPLVAVWMKALLDAAKDFSLMQTSASSSGMSEYLMRMMKASLVVDQWPPGLTKYVGLDLT